MHRTNKSSLVNVSLLERIVAAPDDRQLVEASLAAFQEVAAGDHFSAILFNPETLSAAVFFLGQGWLATTADFHQAAQQKLREHPLARKFLARRQPMTLVRSREVPNAVWQQSEIYNEVDRPLGVEDIATIYQITAAGQVLILTCGRSRRFTDRDLAPIQSYHRVLNGLVPFYRGAAPTNRAETQSPLDALTAREREILHWVRGGKRDPEIGMILGISQRTVQNHLANIYRKLGVETRTAAAFVQ